MFKFGEIIESITKEDKPLDNLIEKLNELLQPYDESADGALSYDIKEIRRNEIISVLANSNITVEDLKKHINFDDRYPYTRNLVKDEATYTLICLCWNPLQESKIHNHPCDGCYVKPIEGEVKETVYEHCKSTGAVTPSHINYYNNPTQVSFMADSQGRLHKIGNPREEGAITLHLYSPPFDRCEIWKLTESGKVKVKSEEVKLFYHKVKANPVPATDFSYNEYGPFSGKFKCDHSIYTI